MCAKGSRMIEGQNYEISYTSTADRESIRFMIAMVSDKKQGTIVHRCTERIPKNVIFHPEDRHYVSVQILYLNWFLFRFPKQ